MDLAWLGKLKTVLFKTADSEIYYNSRNYVTIKLIVKTY